MNFTFYAYYNSKITKHDIIVKDYPYRNTYLGNVTSNIDNNTSIITSVKKAINNEDMKAIECVIDNPKFHSTLLYMMKKVGKSPIIKLETLPFFYLDILKHPRFRFYNIEDQESLFEYLDYRSITQMNYYTMLYKYQNILMSKLRFMLTERFPSFEQPQTNNVEDFIHATLCEELRDVPRIIYTITKHTDINYATPMEFLINEGLDYDAVPFTGELDTDNKNFYMKDNDLMIPIYHYTLGNIEKIVVTITIDNYLRDIYKEEKHLVDILSNIIMITPRQVITLLLLKDIKAVIEFVGEDEDKWIDLSDVFISTNMDDRFIRRHTDEILYIINHKYFRVDSTTITYVSNIGNNIDNIRLKADKRVMYYYFLRRNNRDVLLYMFYTILHSIFKDNKNYWLNLYKYTAIVNSFKGLVTEKHNMHIIIEYISREEGIPDLTINKLYNALAMLDVEYYIVRNDISNFTSFRDYYNSIQVNDTDMSDQEVLNAVLAIGN